MASDIRDCIAHRTATRASRTSPCRRGRSTPMCMCSKPAITLSPDRGYTPPESPLSELKKLHAIRWASTGWCSPSRRSMATDNSAILDGMNALNAETPNRARGVCAMTMDFTDAQLAGAGCAQGIRRRAPEHRQQGRHAAGTRRDPRAGGPHQAVRLAHRVAVPGQGHRRPDAGVREDDDARCRSAISPISRPPRAWRRAGFQALLKLVRDGNTWIKISGANRVSATDLPPYDDCQPLARALIEANADRVMWGTDWPHPNKYEVNPNDADPVEAFGQWVPDEDDAPAASWSTNPARPSTGSRRNFALRLPAGATLSPRLLARPTAARMPGRTVEAT